MVGRAFPSYLICLPCRPLQLRNAGLKSPSILPAWQNPFVTTHALTADEIHAKVREMGEASELVSDAGYAGVDIHALYWGNLIDSFALPYMNLRDDERHRSLTALPALGIPCLNQLKHEAIRLCTNEERRRIRLERLLDEFDCLGIMP